VKLAQFLADDLKRAIAIYLEEAWGATPCPRLPKLPEVKGETVDALLPPKLAGVFRHEPARPPEKIVDEYTLQLGNERYGLMKLVLGEHLIVGEYFLSVDTHDWMFKPDDSDPAEQRAWEETLQYNAALKERIERRWNEAHLPTLHDLRTYLSSSQVCAVKKRERRILIVDDDRIAAQTLAAFLESRGFDYDLAYDGGEGLALADPARHHLVIMDIDMPVKTGLEATAELKADPRRQSIPVLLSSKRPLQKPAAPNAAFPFEIVVKPPAGANAFLVKPFQADVLLYFIESLLKPAGNGGSPDA
jgi:CheY-like chemotaxis protein